ncbi:gamma carbonic anhydrase family protein [Microbulbifer flavimaris]|uniref:Gamma carbonic anhydrase family protein n=1 Tax=Microbulbifer flavimaris TaxID=1781068 RepID=A0ABX4I0D7_9GAMM|nr:MULTISPECIES: gamma carbonic anhydrase family protein [Microbulbifer]KUJ83067.1 gamma carbonic anhydrase family protein [Microbulbifer sp. ZGT114]PCO05253.1 gamma carbonic anhydrase family protein [Microbulbifer flavimaris]
MSPLRAHGNGADQKYPQLGDNVYVDPQAAVIGDVAIGEDSSVWPMAVVRGDMHRIRIGARTSVQDGAVLHITHAGPFNPDGWPLVIGDDVTIGHKACLHGCTVGNRVLVGIGSIVMDGAVIEDEVVLAAGALVPPGKKLESGYLYVGAPCKQARPLSDKEREFFRYSAQNYVKLKNDYLLAEQVQS